MGKIIHIVLWKLKKPPVVSEEAVIKAKQAITALKTVPGPELMHLGPPLLSERAKGYDWGMYSVFSSKEALKTYNDSDAHIDVRAANVIPHIEADVLAYDFELDE